ncbi:MAG TPA: sugar phosphate isomerase/epimerase [Gemmatimonadaceae bacterium]|nr:sugar phosphate isomerase/epimerase [Gemmatimonadaceae bacterium]
MFAMSQLCSDEDMENRRSFLATLGVAALSVSARRALGEGIERLADFPGAPATPKKLARVGMELYTVRSNVSADMAGTLAALAKIGYKEVEFAGYYNHAASEIRDILKANGLTAPSAHVGIEAIETGGAQTFADAKVIGHEFITVASLPRGPKTTADDWKQVAARFNKAGEACKSAGFRFAFHNHNDIVKKTGDVLPIEILMKETDPALVSYEMDIYWAVNGGADPLQLLAAYPGRFSMFHAKDSMGPPDHKMADVGAGVIDFKTIFAKGKGVEHYFVEHDNPPDPMASAAASYKYLSNLEF